MKTHNCRNNLFSFTPRNLLIAMGILLAIFIVTAAAHYLSPSASQGMPYHDYVQLSDRLSSQQVKAFAEDPNGYIMIGTEYGLNRYDGQGYMQYFSTADSCSLPNNNIIAIRYLRHHPGWSIVSTFNGSCILFPNGNTTPLCQGYRTPIELSDSIIVGIYENQVSILSLNPRVRTYQCIQNFNVSANALNLTRQSDTTFWVNVDKDMELYDIHCNYKGKVSLDQTPLFAIPIDSLHYLIIDDSGFNIMNPDDGTFIDQSLCDYLNTQFSKPRDILRAFISNGMLAIHLRDVPGLKLVDLEHQIISDEAFDPIGTTEIGDFLCDSNGNIWCGSRSLGYQTHFTNQTAFVDDGDLCQFFADKDITALSKYPDGRLCICIGRSQIFLCSLNGEVTELDASPINASYLMHVVCRSNGNLLLYGIGHIYECSIDRHNRLHLLHEVPTGYSVYTLFEDSRGRVWAGAQSGCRIIDFESGKVSAININLQRVNNFLELPNGHILAGSLSSGISVINPDTFAERHYDLPLDKDGMFSCRDIALDRHGTVWIATIGMGVHRLDLTTGEVRNYRAPNMCTDVSCILADPTSDNIWMGTLNGLSSLDPTSGRFQTYYETDGVQGNEFYEHCATNSGDHTLIFGGKRGITIFDPAEVHPKVSRKLLVSSIEVNGRILSPNIECGGYHLQNPDGDLQLTLPHDFHNLIFHLSTLDFGNYTNNAVFYQMQGVDPQRIFASQPAISYHSLDPGNYTFEAWTMDQNGEAVSHLSVPVTIRQPWWKAWWLRWIVYPLFGLLSIAYLTLLIVNNIRNRRRIRRSLREKAVIQRMSDANMRFFTNMAHEFRTPLTLISGALGLIKDEHLPEEEQHAHHIISGNTDRMMRLVNQLLDFKKLEADMLKLSVQPYLLPRLISSVVEMFQNGFQEKQIQLDVKAKSISEPVWIDPDKYEKVLFNLLSNALKYTPPQGKVTLTVRPIDRNTAAQIAPLTDSDRDTDWLLTQVDDTGIGISDQLMPYIFERFYQTPEGATHQNGSGIGLYFCHGLVKLHHGFIRAQHNREAEHGSSLYFLLPISETSYRADELNQMAIAAFDPNADPTAADSDITATTPVEPSPIPSDNDAAVQTSALPVVLVVDDDTEVLRFLRLLLQNSYQVVTKSSAIEAIASLSEVTPDLIVSDVMMVGMDGYELCSHLKQDVAYCHLPIILLTAKVSLEERIHGLNVGADAYVTKPFEPDYLKALIQSLLDNRSKVRHLLATSTSVQNVQVEKNTDEDVIVNPDLKKVEKACILEQDSAFMQKLYSFMEEHLSNPELDIPQLLEVVAMSRSKLYYKMQGLVGQTPNAFFRTYRLNRAAEMIREGNEKISYIGELTGFSSSSHFAASFKKQFGVLPSEYKG